MKGKTGEFSVLKWDGTLIKTVKMEELDEVDKWMPGFKSVAKSSVYVHRGARLPIMNDKPDRTFSRIAEGTLGNNGHSVPATMVKFTSTKKQLCCVVVPSNFTTPV